MSIKFTNELEVFTKFYINILDILIYQWTYKLVAQFYNNTNCNYFLISIVLRFN